MKGDAKPYVDNPLCNESPDAAEDCSSNVLVILVTAPSAPAPPF